MTKALDYIWVVEAKCTADTEWHIAFGFKNTPAVHRTRSTARTARVWMEMTNPWNKDKACAVEYRVAKYERIDYGC